MAMVIYNPTNEKFEATYIGETSVIEPDQKIRMDDARARHMLNNLGPRGLVALEYGDEGEGEAKKAEEGRRRNREFKRHQVIRYNQMNESHKQQGLAYIPVPEQIKGYAQELGLAVLEPYQFKDKEVEQIAELKQIETDQGRYIKKLEETNKMQADQLASLQQQMNDLMGMLKSNVAEKTEDVTKSAEAHKVDLAEIRAQLGFVRLPPTHFENWLARRWDDYLQAPPEIQAEIEEKYARLLNKPFPNERPEVQDSAA